MEVLIELVEVPVELVGVLVVALELVDDVDIDPSDCVITIGVPYSEETGISPQRVFGDRNCTPDALVHEDALIVS